MPGAYAHITIVNHAQKLARTSGLSLEAKKALGLHLRFAELGAVSPDYPYLAPGEARWADQMHYTNNAVLMRSGVAEIQKMQGTAREQAMAWLFGFAAHMTGDMTIHPVVERMVGPYAQNKKAHRHCEMHQDAFIFQRMNVGPAQLTQHLTSGIASCSGGSSLELDPSIAKTWEAMLTSAYPQEVQSGKPKMNLWHAGFTKLLLGMSGANRLFAFARHAAADAGLAYPDVAGIDHASYITAVPTPEGLMPYEQVFDRACQNVLNVWQVLDEALQGKGGTALAGMENWNLDTGRSVATGKLLFWKE